MFNKKSLMKDKKASMEMLGNIGIGLLVLIVIFAVINMIAPQILDVGSDSDDANSVFNKSHADYVDPGSLWGDTAPMMKIAAVIIVLSVLMWYVRRMGTGGGQTGGV